MRVLGDSVWKEFQSHEAMQADVLCLIDDTHATAAKLLDDAVMRDGLSDQRLGFRHLAHILVCESKASQRIPTRQSAINPTYGCQ